MTIDSGDVDAVVSATTTAATTTIIIRDRCYYVVAPSMSQIMCIFAAYLVDYSSYTFASYKLKMNTY